MNWMLVNMVILGVGGIGMAWAPNSGMAFAWSIPLGVGGAGFITAANAISQQESPSDMRSRLMALQAVAFLGSTPIGRPITGWIADTVSAPWSLAYGGVISLLCAGGRVGLPDGAPLDVDDPYDRPAGEPPKWLRSAGLAADARLTACQPPSKHFRTVRSTMSIGAPPSTRERSNSSCAARRR